VLTVCHGCERQTMEEKMGSKEGGKLLNHEDPAWGEYRILD